MSESSSSDQQIFKKRRKTHTKPEETLEDLFDDESIESLSEEHYVNQETYTIINEVFGNGDEYNYIYNTTTKNSTSESQNTNMDNNKLYKDAICDDEIHYYENDDILYFIARRTNLTEKEKEELKKLISGESPLLLAYHTDTEFTIQELFEYKERLDEYTKVTKIIDQHLSLNEIAENNHMKNLYSTTTKFIESTQEIEEFKQYFEQLKQNMKKYMNFIGSRFMILPDLFYENYINKQTMHEPSINNERFYIDDDYYSFYTNNPLFIKLVVNFYHEFGVVQESNGNAQNVKECCKDEVKRLNINIKNDNSSIFIDETVFDENLFRFFRANDTFNDERKLFLKKCIANIKNFEHKLKNKCNAEIKKHAKKEMIENVIDRIVNGSIALTENELGCGLYETNGMFYASIINYKGNCINYYSEKNINKIIKDIFENKNDYRIKFIAYLCKEKVMKYTLKNINTTLNEINKNETLVVCVERFIVDSLHDNTNHKSYATGIAKRVLFPEIEFCKMYNKNISIKNNLLNKKEVLNCMKRGIQVSFSIIGIDVNLLRFSEFKDCLPILDLSSNFNEMINEFGTVESLQSLEHTVLTNNTSNNTYIFGNKINDYNNACCYLRIKSNIYSYNNDIVLLDSFMVHPKNYRLANFICSAALNIDTVDDNVNEVIENACKESEKLKNLNMKSLNYENYKLLNKIRVFLLCYTRNEYKGISDKTIFEEIVGFVDMKINYEGRIKKVGDKYVIVEIHSKKIEVFVQKTTSDSFFVNQIVYVQLLEPDYCNLSYTGTIINTEKKKRLKFIEHPLFKYFDGYATEKFLHENNKILVLRKSGQNDDAVITIKIDTSKKDSTQPKNNRHYLMHYKLVEQENGYLFENMIYDKIDEFISVYIRSVLQNIKKIKKHMRYCESEEEASYNVSKMNYCFYLSMLYPGKVVFAYKYNGNMKKEYLSIGMKLRNNEREFENLDDFILYKKKSVQ